MATAPVTDRPSLSAQSGVVVIGRERAAGALVAELEGLGHSAVVAERSQAVLDTLGEEPALVCFAVDDRDGDTAISVRLLRAARPALPILVVAGARGAGWVVEVMRAGASDCLLNPADGGRLAQAVSAQLAARAHASGSGAIAPVGHSAVMRAVFEQLARVARTDVTVCLRGETGSGKEVLAQAIHASSLRSRGPFVAVNCAAIPPQLQESDLFGHERGAFTGAMTTHRGRFEQADGGTLFLDELGEMEPATQAALLRVIDDRRVQRIGSLRPLPVDIRVICATHRDLEADVAAGRFRQDLYFRLSVYRISVPPLRERLDDLPLLAAHALRRCAPAGAAPKRLATATANLLRAYSWPGNVRELQNVLTAAALACDGSEILPAHLPPLLFARPSQAPATHSAHQAQPPAIPAPQLIDADDRMTFKEIEKRTILRAIDMSGGSVDRAAQALGLSRSTVYRRLVQYGVQIDEVVSRAAHRAHASSAPGALPARNGRGGR